MKLGTKVVVESKNEYQAWLVSLLLLASDVPSTFFYYYIYFFLVDEAITNSQCDIV
jgi:hypothetical protein